MTATGSIPELQTSRPDGSPRTRMEMDEWMRKEVPKVHWLRLHACRTFDLPKSISFDMKEIILRHWILDEMTRRHLIVGDLLGVSTTNYNDDSEFRQFTQRLVSMIQAGQAVQPQHAEGIEMSGYTPPPPPVMGPPGAPAPGPGPAYSPGPPQAPQQYQPPGPPMAGGYPPGPPQPPAPPQQQYAAPPQAPMGPPGYAPPPPGVPAAPQMGAAPMGPPGAPPPAPPQAAAPAAPAAGRRGRKPAGEAAAPSAPPPPVAPGVPAAPQGFAPAGYAQAPAPQGFTPPVVNQGAPLLHQAGGAPQETAPAAEVDLTPLLQKIDQLTNLVSQQAQANAALTKKVELLSMATTIVSRAIYQKQGSADITGFLTELGIPLPQ